MNPATLRCIVAGLEKFQLTEAETELVHFARLNLSPNNPLRKMMELSLEKIYRQKTAFMRGSILSLLKQDTEAQLVQVSNHPKESGKAESERGAG